MAIKLGKEAAFKGETFSDMIAPLKEYATAYKEVEANYDTLAMETEKIRQMMANEDTNSQAYQTYQDYYNRLNDTVTDFARGMNIRNRSALSGMKRGYAQNIVPISNALTLKKSLVDAQDKGRAADSSVIYRKDANSYSLDELIANPTQGVGDVISGKNIFQNAAHMAANLAKELRSEKVQQLFPYTYRFLQQHGWSSDAVHKVLREGMSGENPLGYIVNQAVNATGVQNWGDDNAYQKALEWASMGAWDAIGKTETDKVNDTFGMQMALQAAKQADTAKAVKAAQDNALYQNIIASHIYTPQQEKAKSNIRQWVKKGYIETDEGGNLKVTQEGKNKLSKQFSAISEIEGVDLRNGSPYTGNGDFDINKYLSQQGITKADLDESTLWNDTSRKTKWHINISDTNTQKTIKNAILNAVGNNKPYEAEFDGESGVYKRGKTTDILTDEDSTITGVSLSPYGHYLMVRDKKGKMHNILMGMYMNGNSLSAINDIMSKITGSISQYNAGNATEETKKQAEQSYRNLILTAFDTLMRSMSGSQTSPVKYGAGMLDQSYSPYYTE